MRVAVVVERLWPGRGGVESAAHHLVEELARRNLDVTAVCRVAADPIPAGVRVLRLRVPASWQPLRLLAFSRAAARVTRNGFDVVVASRRRCLVCLREDLCKGMDSNSFEDAMNGVGVFLRNPVGFFKGRSLNDNQTAGLIGERSSQDNPTLVNQWLEFGKVGRPVDLTTLLPLGAVIS